MEEKKLNIYEKLMNIQQELKCNKGQYNSFGKYRYRSCEDILESVKPLLEKYGVVLTLSDAITVLGDNEAVHYQETYYDKDLKKENTRNVVINGQRYYIRATATIIDVESEKSISNTAYAREEETKKGMDGSQITGTASSYARKYALNGLLAIDDTKDADTDEFKRQTIEEEKATDEQVEYIKQLVECGDIEEETVKEYLKRCGKKKTRDLSKKEAAEFIGEE